MTDSSNIIAFQGVLGAYSHMACQAVKPEMEVLPCRSFEDMILAVQEGRAELAMVPVENSIAGRVADIHHLLPGSGLYINCLLYTSPSPRDDCPARMPSSA